MDAELICNKYVLGYVGLSEIVRPITATECRKMVCNYP